MRIADYATTIESISTTLRHRFEAVRGHQAVEHIAVDIGITPVTLCTWLAQYRTTRIDVLTKIEAWVEAQEHVQHPMTPA